MASPDPAAPSFGNLLYSFILRGQALSPEYEHHVLVFIAGCAVFGCVAIVTDVCYAVIKGGSVLGIKYNWKTFLPVLVVWIIGAGIGGFLGQLFQVLQTTPLASAMAGIGWPLILTNIVREKVNSKIENQASGAATASGGSR